MELAIDTSTNVASIALSRNGEVIDQSTWLTDHNHTVELIPAIVRILDHCQVAITDMNAVIVAKGPGSFNGLRVGLATGKGLAYSLSIPIVGVGTLDAIAMSCVDTRNTICSMMQAGRDELATATYQFSNGELRNLEPEHITSLDKLIDGIQDETIICGEIADDQQEKIKSNLGTKVVTVKQTGGTGRAEYLAKLGWCRISNGTFDNPSALQPLYIRKPSITSPKRRNNDAMSNMRKGI